MGEMARIPVTDAHDRQPADRIYLDSGYALLSLLAADIRDGLASRATSPECMATVRDDADRPFEQLWDEMLRS